MNIGCTVLLISDTVFSVGKRLEFLKRCRNVSGFIIASYIP